MRGRLSTTWLAVCAAAFVAAMPSPCSANHLIRGMSPEAQLVIDRAIRDSPTVARMVETLDRADVIVMVRMITLPFRLDGELVLVGSAREWRYLLVSLVDGASIPDAVASLGHELQHALEVASDPRVRDQAGMKGLFEHIGSGPVGGPYETVAAIEVGKAVRREVS